MISKPYLVIDTDVGTDCDDAFALTYALKNQNVQIKAICTVQEHYKMRGKIARKIMRITGKELPIIIGADGQEKWWTGIETKVLTATEMMEPLEQLDFPEYEANMNIAAIGPLTNIAAQLKNNPTIKLVKNIYVMGSSEKSHNFEVDPKATQEVFDQPWNIYQITKEDSLKLKFTLEELADLRKTKIGNFLVDSALNSMKMMKLKSTAMYDVLVVSAAMNENYVKFKQIGENRFISCGVDLLLKNKLLETITNAN